MRNDDLPTCATHSRAARPRNLRRFGALLAAILSLVSAACENTIASSEAPSPHIVGTIRIESNPATGAVHASMLPLSPQAGSVRRVTSRVNASVSVTDVDCKGCGSGQPGLHEISFNLRNNSSFTLTNVHFEEDTTKTDNCSLLGSAPSGFTLGMPNTFNDNQDVILAVDVFDGSKPTFTIYVHVVATY
jgi:hypothetical protein